MRGLDPDERTLVADMLAGAARPATEVDDAAAIRMLLRGLLELDFGEQVIRLTALGRDVYRWNEMAR